MLIVSECKSIRFSPSSLILPLYRYCNQVLSKEIDESVTLLLQELVRFQERVYQKDPTKAKSKRRLVMGLREVTKHMKLQTIKCVIISPNCEKIQAKGDCFCLVSVSFCFLNRIDKLKNSKKKEIFGGLGGKHLLICLLCFRWFGWSLV